MEISLKEWKEWENKVYNLQHAIDRLLKYPNSQMGRLLDTLYDTLGENPVCIEELSVGETIIITE